jgi:hypothetical protein
MRSSAALATVSSTGVKARQPGSKGVHAVKIDLTGAKWFKSSRSSAGRECVEVAHLTGGFVGVRDTKNPTGPALTATRM